MSFIRDLVSDRFNLFNVDNQKCPCDRNGKRMANWNTKTYDELVSEHNYKSEKWGLSLGKQSNDRYIMSLDFDCYSKNLNGDCPATKLLLTEYLANCKNNHGIYSSSTEGNMNVLVDYSRSESLKSLFAKIGGNKFQNNGLEILIRGNQVIPPTQTNCKKTQTLGNARTFQNPDFPFYIIDGEDDYTFQFIEKLCSEKLKPNPKPNPKPKPQKDGDDMSEVTHVTGYDSKTCEKQNKKIKEIKLLFQAILETTPTFFDTYIKWAEIGFLIHNETNGSLEGCELFRELTKKDVPYPEVCKQYYATQKSRDKSNQLKLASLKAWLKQENPDHVLLLGSEDEHFVDNDDGAINIIMEGLKSRFIFTNDQMYFKEGNLWVKDKPMIMDFLMKHILESKIYKSNKHNELVSYCQNVGTSKSVREGLLAKLSVSTRDDTLYSRFHSSTKNKLCFNDGVLDFVEKSFTLWDDIPPNTIFTTVIINRDYADYFKQQNTQFIDAINSDIIGNLFGNKSKLAKQFFSRAITGNIQDKNFASYCGNRDCGKGILYALFESAFCGYVAPFAIQNMTCERESKKSSDLAKENAWLIPLQYARLAIAQETDENENDDISNKLKINNKVMKTVMSGGDTILARELYQSPIRFTIDATLAIFGNNELSITNSDSAQHHLKFNGVKQFVTQEAYNKHLKMGDQFASAYAVRDETLKDKVKTDDYANAMVHILYSEYVDKSICIHNAENEDGERVLTLREMLFDKFEFTGNDKDRISKLCVYSVVKGDKKKIIAELESLGCVGDSKSCKVVVNYKDESGNVKGKQEQAFKGIIFKPEPEEEQSEHPPP